MSVREIENTQYCIACLAYSSLQSAENECAKGGVAKV